MIQSPVHKANTVSWNVIDKTEQAEFKLPLAYYWKLNTEGCYCNIVYILQKLEK